MPVNTPHTSAAAAAGIAYVGDLKAGLLADSAVVINMSLRGPELDAIEKAAIDYAIGQGVLIVASAGNEGEAGTGYPGTYEPVISVAASGWAGECLTGHWWWAVDDPEPNSMASTSTTSVVGSCPDRIWTLQLREAGLVGPTG